MNAERINEITENAKALALEAKAMLATAETHWDAEGEQLVKTVYLGSILNLTPSGKVYALWTTNQTEDDVDADEIWFEELEKALDEFGAWHHSSEGDGCDVMASQAVKLPDDVFTVTWPACWAPYLINGDASGIDESDVKEANEAVDRQNCVVLSVEGESFFDSHPDDGMGGDCAIYLVKNKE